MIRAEPIVPGESVPNEMRAELSWKQKYYHLKGSIGSGREEAQQDVCETEGAKYWREQANWWRLKVNEVALEADKDAAHHAHEMRTLEAVIQRLEYKLLKLKEWIPPFIDELEDTLSTFKGWVPRFIEQKDEQKAL